MSSVEFGLLARICAPLGLDQDTIANATLAAACADAVARIASLQVITLDCKA